MTRYYTLSVSAVAALLLSGCACVSQQQVDEVRAIAEEALRTANTADYHAHQAKTMADEALAGSHRALKNLKIRGMMK